ncbi:MAG: LysR family transcriptional regulator [Phascolarctobacterium sp.]|nr:LysR family transcriptional regulator [Phascolarctobacterium sp.]
MDIKQIEYFKTLCETKNYTKAAELLHIAQPSLSVAIKKLEEELDTQLLVRDNKKVLLTIAGSVFLTECNNVLKQFSHLEMVMEEFRETEHKPLKIAFPSTIGAWLWPVLLNDFSQSHPEVKLQIEDLSTREIIERIDNDELEIGYGVIDYNSSPEIVSETLSHDNLKLLLNIHDPLSQGERIDIHALEGKRIIMYKKGSSITEQLFLQEIASNNINVEIQYVKEQATVFNLVAQNIGAAVVLDKTTLIDNNSLLCTKPFTSPIKFSCGFFWKKDRHLSAGARKLLNYFYNSFKL